MNVLIVDDEQLARELLAAFLMKTPGFSLAGAARNIRETEEILATKTIDLILLDIEMPGGRGTDFMRSLTNPPLVIFTTAYKSYAIEGYAFNPVDYLLKPISYASFSAAMQKARGRYETEQKALAYDRSVTDPTQYLTVREGHTTKKVAIDRITHITAMREYVCYHTDEGRTMELKSISKVTNELSEAGFVRIHRSYLVAKRAVQSFDAAKVVLFSGIELPIGKTFRKEVKIALL